MNIDVERVNCDLCSSADISLRYKIPDLRFYVTEQEFSVVSCKHCDHWYLNPRPTEADLKKCYPACYYDTRGQDIPSQKIRYEHQASYFKKRRPERFLDIGCATGAFLETMLAQNWSCYGMDFVDYKREELSSKIKFECGSLDNIGYPTNYFDGISAWGVFEHLLSPRTYFIEVGRILKPHGLFVMMVPNARSLWSRFAYKEDIPRHLHFFTPAIIQKYANIAGLKIKKINYTNSIYSRPATGRDAFRINLLKTAGVPWREINNPPTKFHLKALSVLGSVLGRILIHPCLEKVFGLSGMMVICFTKD